MQTRITRTLNQKAFWPAGPGLACGIAAACLAVTLSLRADEHREHSDGPQVEPNAGSWRTWVISSGKDFRVPPPPGNRETRKELKALKDLISQNDAQARQQIEFWDAGSPAYRWMDLLNSRMIAGTPTTAYAHRVYTYVAQAMYDATVAAWESKYFYNRPRPSQLDDDLPTALQVPNSPSYPSPTPKGWKKGQI